MLASMYLVTVDNMLRAAKARTRTQTRSPFGVVVTATTDASSMQASCKHHASLMQADTFYMQATIWRIAGVQVLARLEVFKSPPKYPYYNINKEAS